MEGYEQEEKRGKELHKDQKEALAKYPEVLGQIDCVKELSEQLKKIHTDVSKFSFHFKELNSTFSCCFYSFLGPKTSKTSCKTIIGRKTSSCSSTCYGICSNSISSRSSTQRKRKKEQRINEISFLDFRR